MLKREAVWGRIGIVGLVVERSAFRSKRPAEISVSIGRFDGRLGNCITVGDDNLITSRG